MTKLYQWQIKQNKQLLSQLEALYSSNKHKNKIDWSQRQRGEAKMKIIFLVSQAVQQKWKTLPSNKQIAIFANCGIRWVKRVINKFLGLRKWLGKMNNKVRKIKNITVEMKIEIKERLLKSLFGYFNKDNQVWMYLE